jgi:Transposase DDE domain
MKIYDQISFRKKNDIGITMHINQFLHTLLSPVMHLKRLKTLSLLTVSALKDRKLSVTLLGRSLNTDASEKNNIKRSDRFLSNEKLYEEREAIYATFTCQLIGAKRRPWIIVDWSPSPNSKNHILRAALVMEGRALSVYEEVHPKAKENNPEVHKNFLSKLKNMLAENSRPIIITDAGFCTPWFQQVESMGWDYVGRVRGDKAIKLKGSWMKYKDLFSEATSEPSSLGEGLLSQNEFKTHFYLVKLPKKFRVRLNKLGKKGNHKKDKEYSKSWNEPWLLVSSLTPSYIVTKRVVKIYTCRMQIEEGFRDLKSSLYGFSFEKSQTKNTERIQILLLIAMVASAIAYLVGWVAENKQWHYQFQANTIKTRRVLSFFYLGCRVIKKKLQIPIECLWEALNKLSESGEWAEYIKEENEPIKI